MAKQRTQYRQTIEFLYNTRVATQKQTKLRKIRVFCIRSFRGVCVCFPLFGKLLKIFTENCQIFNDVLSCFEHVLKRNTL